MSSYKVIETPPLDEEEVKMPFEKLIMDRN
jgi:hypothetical protein